MARVARAMERSLREEMAEAVLENLYSRDVDDVKTTFSSWGNCMQQKYCQYPAIALIVIASITVIGIIWCIARCCCCASSCCCSCFSFLSCCDCCGGLCDGKKNKPPKHLDQGYPNNQGYQAPAPMMGGGFGGGGFGAAAGGKQPAQFASFDVGPTGHAIAPTPAISEDALPPMPSWEGASKKHVLEEDEKNGVELGELDHKTGQHVPLISGGLASGSTSPSHDISPGLGGPSAGYMEPKSRQDSFSKQRPYGQHPGFDAQGRAYPARGPGTPSQGMGDPRLGPGGYGSPSPRSGPSPRPGLGGLRNGPGQSYGPGGPENTYDQEQGYSRNGSFGMGGPLNGSEQSYGRNGSLGIGAPMNSQDSFARNGSVGMGGPTNGQGRGYGPQGMGMRNGSGQGFSTGQGHDGYDPHGPQEMGTGTEHAYGTAFPQELPGQDHFEMSNEPYSDNAPDSYGRRPSMQRDYSAGSDRPLNPGRQYSDRSLVPSNPQMGPGGRGGPPPNGQRRAPGSRPGEATRGLPNGQMRPQRGYEGQQSPPVASPTGNYGGFDFGPSVPSSPRQQQGPGFGQPQSQGQGQYQPYSATRIPENQQSSEFGPGGERRNNVEPHAWDPVQR